MMSLEDALARILVALPPPTSEYVPLADGDSRVLAEDAFAAIDLPPFDNSAMDGYAVRAEDVVAASPHAPVSLRVIGRAAAGEAFSGELKPGECVRLFTGSPLPRGADAVVMQEDARADPAQTGVVLILDSARPGENVRRRGDDVARGMKLAVAGEVLTPGRIALLAATGIREARVGKRPRAGLLATGSELREGGQPLKPGQIYESNRAALAPLVNRAGGLPQIYPLVPDAPADTRAALELALGECDVVVTTGGVSVGETDFVKSAFVELGGRLEFWRVAIRPGKPFVFGRCGEKFLFGLPGNPVSAMVTFLLLARPALWRWQGACDIALPAHPGVLAEPLSNPGDRRHFVRVRLDSQGRVVSAGRQASHALGSFAQANGLVDLAPGATLPAGQSVPVLIWD